jgi:hypothetical protein
MRLRPYLTDRASPLFFAAGLCVSFLYCRHLGEVAGQNPPFTGMVRAPQAVDPTTGCAPTVGQMTAMCKARAGRDKVLVVVGGNSVFLGIRQPLEDLWSAHLQEQLGDGYAVVNLAQRAQGPVGGAGSIAEALLKEGRRVIYLASMDHAEGGAPDGRPPYTYIYWNAASRGLLFPYPARDAFLAREEASRRGGGVNRQELRIRAEMDRLSNAEDLWNTVSYTRFSTVWNPVPDSRSYLPRMDSKDYEGPSPPVPQRFEPTLQEELEQLQGIVRGFQRLLVDTDGFQQEIETGIVPQMRRNSLIVVTSACPYYVRRAPVDVQQRYARFVAKAVEILGRQGLHAMEVGSGFEDADFGDFVHFEPSGGRKLADAVAPEVRKIAHELYGI